MLGFNELKEDKELQIYDSNLGLYINRNKCVYYLKQQLLNLFKQDLVYNVNLEKAVFDSLITKFVDAIPNNVVKCIWNTGFINHCDLISSIEFWLDNIYKENVIFDPTNPNYKIECFAYADYLGVDNIQRVLNNDSFLGEFNFLMNKIGNKRGLFLY